MEDSRKICLAALYRSKDQIKQQPSREIIHMLITQLENKHLEEQLLKLKLVTEKGAGWQAEHNEKKSTVFTYSTPSSLIERSVLLSAESSSLKEQPLTNMEEDQPAFTPTKPSSLDKSAFSGRSLSSNPKMSGKPSKDTVWTSRQAGEIGVSEEPGLGTTAEKIASTSQGVNEKQQATSTGDAEATARNSKWKDDPEAEASAQNPVRRKGNSIGSGENRSGEPNKPLTNSQTTSESTEVIKACITTLFNHPKKHSELCSTALNQLFEISSTEKKITPTYIVIQNSGIPILISEANLATTQTVKCTKNGSYNETLDEPLNKNELVYRLLGHMDQVTNL